MARLAADDEFGVRADGIESSVADEFWTLPKYAEMLFLV